MKQISALAMATAALWFTACSADQQREENGSSDKIQQEALYFLPRLALSSDQDTTISIEKVRLPNHEHRFWIAKAFTLPGYSQLQLLNPYIDAQSATQPSARSVNGLVLHPAKRDPLSAAGFQAVWLNISRQEGSEGIASNNWLPVMLMPDTAIVVKAERKRRSQLAEKLADKAYFFGYATNEDALE